MSCGDVDSFQDDPQHKVMKYLVFGTILRSLFKLSELQIIIPKTDRMVDEKLRVRLVNGPN